MKKVDKIEKDTKTKIIIYILEEYDKDYRKTFEKKEFEDLISLNEIISELKELKYIKERKEKFTISLLGIRHIREILFAREQYIENIKMQWSSILLSLTIAFISNAMVIYSFDSNKMRIQLIILELVMIYFMFKGIEKIEKM